jgi:hypothetical protein
MIFSLYLSCISTLAKPEVTPAYLKISKLTKKRDMTADHSLTQIWDKIRIHHRNQGI